MFTGIGTLYGRAKDADSIIGMALKDMACLYSYPVVLDSDDVSYTELKEAQMKIASVLDNFNFGLDNFQLVIQHLEVWYKKLDEKIKPLVEKDLLARLEYLKRREENENR